MSQVTGILLVLYKFTLYDKNKTFYGHCTVWIRCIFSFKREFIIPFKLQNKLRTMSPNPHNAWIYYHWSSIAIKHEQRCNPDAKYYVSIVANKMWFFRCWLCFCNSKLIDYIFYQIRMNRIDGCHGSVRLIITQQLFKIDYQINQHSF